MKRLFPAWPLLLALGVLVITAVAGLFGVIDPQGAGALFLAEGIALDPVKIKEALDKISSDVKEVATKAMADVEKNGKLSTDLKAECDKLLVAQGETKSRLDEVELLMQKLRKGAEQPDPFADDPLHFFPALEKAKGEIGAFKEGRAQNKTLNIPVSRKSLTNTGVTGAALNYPGTALLGGMPLVPLLRKLYVRDLLAPGRISTAVAFYPRESGYTNNAAPVSEGSLKPKSELTFELITEPVRTIAHLFDVSLQMLDDIPYLQSYIGTRGLFGLKTVEDVQLLTGSGTGQNLSGIYTEATAYAQPSGVTIDPTKETDIDKLRLALLQVELADAFASGIILHPTDWASIELLKDTQNRYLFVNPQDVTRPMLWGRTVVSTRAMTQTKFLVGDFAAHAQILDRQDANIAISFENKDNFERNMATIRVEERLALAVYRPEALIKGTLESAS